MVKLTPPDQMRLEAAITAAEKQTSAEIVIAVTDVSDDYRMYPLLGSAVLGFISAGIIALLWPEMHVRFAFLIAGIAALVAWFLLQLPPLRLLLVPKDVQQRAATSLAQAEFAERVAGQTRDANGVLIFAALAEHFVAIIPDIGLGKIVPEATWQAIVGETIAKIKAGQPLDGLLAAIEASARILSEKSPRRADDRNELEDAVIRPKSR
jgi:putative membrane protein